MMKTVITLVACTLIFSFSAVLASQSSFGPEECCFKFASRPLPMKKVTSYKYTDKLCPMEGVLFKMQSGVEICADPSVEWAKNITEAKEKVKAKILKSSLHKN